MGGLQRLFCCAAKKPLILLQASLALRYQLLLLHPALHLAVPAGLDWGAMLQHQPVQTPLDLLLAPCIWSPIGWYPESAIQQLLIRLVMGCGFMLKRPCIKSLHKVP